jgi:hypothetical protein
MTQEKLLTADEMAQIYRCSTRAAFLQRYNRDRRRPEDLRTIPDPINIRNGGGVEYLWAPGAVSKVLAGEGVAKKGGRR